MVLLGVSEMAEPKHASVEFGIWLRKRRNFYLFALASFGGSSWLILVWQFGQLGGALWITFLALVALLGSLLWGFGVWHLLVVPLVNRLESSHRGISEHTNDGDA